MHGCLDYFIESQREEGVDENGEPILDDDCIVGLMLDFFVGGMPMPTLDSDWNRMGKDPAIKQIKLHLLFLRFSEFVIVKFESTYLKSWIACCFRKKGPRVLIYLQDQCFPKIVLIIDGWVWPQSLHHVVLSGQTLMGVNLLLFLIYAAGWSSFGKVSNFLIIFSFSYRVKDSC